ncbi:MAG: hypothetical protein P4L84_27550 [Isosphaeraceae bacterium]|nr:hypothetical protein [Isosphaeraceae bacterium]
MSRTRWREFVGGLSAVVMGLLAGTDARGQEPAQGASAPGVPEVVGGSVWSIEQIVRMSPAELDALYAQGVVAAVPAGRVKGHALVAPGKPWAAPASKGARVVWQGKIFDPSGTAVVNRFFGVKAIKGNVYAAESWRDGQPALIIDYSETSRVYARYRDEIRQVGPGLYLGLMYTRSNPPELKRYFALEAGR